MHEASQPLHCKPPPQVGSVLGVSTVATFAESTAGVADGAKTGLASLVTGTCFLLAIPFSPVVSAVPGPAFLTDIFAFLACASRSVDVLSR